MTPHKHYRRWRHSLAESPSERLYDDSRRKLLVNIVAPDENLRYNILVEPALWNMYQEHLLPLIRPMPPIYLQEGPTCGLYAMKIVHPELDVPNLLSHARAAGMTVVGEMFCAREWVKLAHMFGVQCECVPIHQIPFLFANSQGIAIVPYDSDPSGIAFRNGSNAHWGVVWEMWNAPDALIILMTHSSLPIPVMEKWDELLASNLQLRLAQVRVNKTEVDVIEANCLSGYAVWVPQCH